MNIVNANLDLLSTPQKRDTDFYSLISTKIVLMSENMDNIQIDLIHNAYREINLVGIPYHYVIKKDGTTYSTRSRVYRAGPKYSYQNIFKNAICILVEGLESENPTDLQSLSIIELLTEIIMQDNLLVSDIVSMKQILYGVQTTALKNIIASVRGRVSAVDVHRTVGDFDTTTTFRKIVAGGCINSLNVIALYTKIPVTYIAMMNKHVALYPGSISPGTTIFLPDNRVSGYMDGIYDSSIINIIYTKMLSNISKFKDILNDYRKEVG